MVQRSEDCMVVSTVVIGLSILIAVLAVVASAAGIFWEFGTDPTTYVTERGEEVELYGQGLYRYDSLFRGAGFRGTDVIVILIVAPLLLISTYLYRRRSVPGGLLLLGALAFMVYNYASISLSASFNQLFLLYVVLFSASLLAFFQLLRSFDVPSLSARFSERLPRRFIAGYMIASGVVTAVVWLMPQIAWIVDDEIPERMDNATTMVTDVLDLGIIVPLTIISGVLLLRRDPRGYFVAFPLLMVVLLLVPMISAQTASQVTAGVTLSAGEIIGPLAGFIVLGSIGVWIIVRLLRDIAYPAT
ncbi:MAG: hypothetical protein R2849_03975 [Thermomicrobiales bacterium]